jgi:glutathione synthase/RimK-type ligase-like ATP-grasp enzyme
VWFLPNYPISPPVWDYSRQVREFAAALERQGNRLFCSSTEMAFWENKVHMHQELDRAGAPTPATRILTADTWHESSFDLEPVLLKEEHSSSSDGIHHFNVSADARRFVAGYPFRPGESLIMQEVVRGATRDMRVTVVGDRVIASASYWRTKSLEALASSHWTTTATSYNSRVDHAAVPAAVQMFVATYLRALGVRMAGVDLIWTNDDITQEPLILEFSPHYQPNPPKPARYADLSYKEFKSKWAAPEGYLECQYQVFREIAAAILDGGFF